jgi:hypothetical protein
MRDTPYYSVRAGTHPTGGSLDLAGFKHLFLAIYNGLADAGAFQQVLGFVCVDAGFVAGTAGRDPEAFVFRKLRKHSIWPIPDHIDRYSEDDLFDVIELLHDCVSKGLDGQFHSYAECGWHYATFDQDAGRNEYRTALNEILRDYGRGYRLSRHGEVVSLAPPGLGDLESAPGPPGDPDKIQGRVASAVRKFRRRAATPDERRDAIRDLADVLEYLRPQLGAVLLSKDEAELFNLANNFGIRHHNQKQKTAYDGAIWHSWMFYYYLATIHATTRLLARKSTGDRR